MLIWNHLWRYLMLISKKCLAPCTLCTELEFLINLWGLGTEQEQGNSTGPPGYIGWRNSFLGIDSWASETFKCTGSGCTSCSGFMQIHYQTILSLVCRARDTSAPLVTFLNYKCLNHILSSKHSQPLFFTVKNAIITHPVKKGCQKYKCDTLKFHI